MNIDQSIHNYSRAISSEFTSNAPALCGRCSASSRNVLTWSRVCLERTSSVFIPTITCPLPAFSTFFNTVFGLQRRECLISCLALAVRHVPSNKQNQLRNAKHVLYILDNDPGSIKNSHMNIAHVAIMNYVLQIPKNEINTSF